jgi:hypothetical protein
LLLEKVVKLLLLVSSLKFFPTILKSTLVKEARNPRKHLLLPMPSPLMEPNQLKELSQLMERRMHPRMPKSLQQLEHQLKKLLRMPKSQQEKKNPKRLRVHPNQILKPHQSQPQLEKQLPHHHHPNQLPEKLLLHHLHPNLPLARLHPHHHHLNQLPENLLLLLHHPKRNDKVDRKYLL